METAPVKIEYKTLQLRNENNVLATGCFLYLGKAPVWPATLPGRNVQYLVFYMKNDLNLKLVDYYEWKFKDISNLITLPATGSDADAWRNSWMEKYPETLPDTLIGIYVYKRV